MLCTGVEDMCYEYIKNGQTREMFTFEQTTFLHDMASLHALVD
jgi:hypothetical protein